MPRKRGTVASTTLAEVWGVWGVWADSEAYWLSRLRFRTLAEVGIALYFNVALAVVAAAASVLRGKRYIYGTEDEKLEMATPIVKTSKRADAADPSPNTDKVAQNDPRLKQKPKARLRRTQSEA